MEKDGSGTKTIAQSPGHQQQGGENKRVSVEHPFQPNDIRAESSAEGIECDIDHADVKENEKET
ncbi:hypothetical protein thsrh120_56860 [Rhizobium sp. No.120]